MSLGKLLATGAPKNLQSYDCQVSRLQRLVPLLRFDAVFKKGLSANAPHLYREGHEVGGHLGDLLRRKDLPVGVNSRVHLRTNGGTNYASEVAQCETLTDRMKTLIPLTNFGEWYRLRDTQGLVDLEERSGHHPLYALGALGHRVPLKAMPQMFSSR